MNFFIIFENDLVWKLNQGNQLKENGRSNQVSLKKPWGRPKTGRTEAKMKHVDSNTYQKF